AQSPRVPGRGSSLPLAASPAQDNRIDLRGVPVVAFCRDEGPSRRRDVRAVPRLLRRAVGHRARWARGGAARGLMRSLLALLAAPDVTHVACAFDHVIESFRNGLFDGYKTSDGVPRDLLAQFTLAERLTHALGIVVWSMVEFEADDALATAAARFADAPDVEQVVICTPDKVLAQCVRGSRVVMFDRRRR